MKFSFKGRALTDPLFLSVFTVTAVVQTSHMVEHIAQVVQKFGLGWTRAHGIIGVFDLEWVHFIYNGALLMAVCWLLAAGWQSMRAKNPTAAGLFAVGVVWQTYHMTEHVVKIAQHLETGAQGTPGILGMTFNTILLHFTYNLVELALVLIPLFMLGLHEKLAKVRVQQ